MAADVLEGDPFGKAVAVMVRGLPERRWTGTAGQLLELVTPDKAVPKSWPKDATRAGGRLKRVAPLMRQAGISFDDSEREPQGNRSRLYTLTVIPDASRPENGARAAAPAAPGTVIDLRQRAGASAGAGAASTRSTRTDRLRVLRVLARALRTSQHPHLEPMLTSVNTALRVLRVLRVLP